MTEHEPIELAFDYGDQQVNVTVSGFVRGVTALKALSEVGLEETLTAVAKALHNREYSDETIVLDYEYEDDQATVTVTGYTTRQRAVDALAQAGGEGTFTRLYSALNAEGDRSMLELL